MNPNEEFLKQHYPIIGVVFDESVRLEQKEKIIDATTTRNLLLENMSSSFAPLPKLSQIPQMQTKIKRHMFIKYRLLPAVSEPESFTLRVVYS